MANTPIAPIAPPDQVAVITPPDATLQSAVGNGEQWNELENQVLDTFKSRADQAAQRGANGQASDSTGAETEAAQSPADQGSAPVVTPPVTPAPVSPPVSPISPITPATDAPLTPPVVAAPAPAPADSGQPGPEPGTPPAQVAAPGTPAGPEATGALPAPPSPETAHDPFAVAAPPAGFTPAPAPGQVPSPASPPPGYMDFMGTPIPVQQAQVMRDTYEWASSLTQEESNAINAFIQQQRSAPPGTAPQSIQPTAVQPGYPPAPGAPYPGQPQAYAVPQPNGAQPLAPPTIDPSTIDDPALATFLNQQAQWFAQQQAQQQQIIAQQQQALAQVSQQTQSVVQRDAETQAAHSYQRLDQARWDFALRHNLSPAELEMAEARLAQSNLLSPFIERKNGDVYAGTLDGLETVLWTDPQLRARAMAQEVAPAVTDAREIQQRAARIGALGGSGGTVPTPTPTATAQDRHNGMVAEITAAMNQQPS